MNRNLHRTVIFDSSVPNLPAYAAPPRVPIGACYGWERRAPLMDERSSFDLHLAECTAQAAAIWLVLEEMLRFQLRDVPHMERVEFFGRLLKAAETITLPAGEEPSRTVSGEWIAHRYWELIDNFISREVQWNRIDEG